MDQKVSRGIRAELGASRRCRGIRGVKGHQGCRDVRVHWGLAGNVGAHGLAGG